MASSAKHRFKHSSNLNRGRWPNFRKIINLYKTYPPLRVFNDSKFTGIISFILIIVEILINILVIERIPYTEIDWKAYMQEVEGVLNGTLDYENLKGDTGPLVYPAGFVYVFLLLYTITERGTNVYFAQYIFATLYIFTLFLVFRLYKRSKVVPPYALVFMCLTSYRIHSIYILRLFNDSVAVCILFLAVNFFIDNSWTVGCILFSFAVSVKMNILLFAPGLFALLLLATGLKGTILNIVVCAIVQILVALPFLLANPVSYVFRSFNLGRVFLYEWTVNWRFLPEEIFVSFHFHLILLMLHIVVLLLFAWKWKKVFLLNSHGNKNMRSYPTIDCILLLLFTSNFIGIVFCRSLHYQFYVWYFFTLPYLLWTVRYNAVIKLCVLGFLELSWNTFPSTVLSSATLHCCHLAIICGLYSNIPKRCEEGGKKTQ